ncbi:MAG: hypothetical protein N3F67_03990 [Acidilobaceae archaeon]|nr:hypothetical protein [Acidilobaceae archaeon]
MSEYLEQLRDLIKDELLKYGLTPNLTKEGLNIMRSKDIVMTIRDLKDYVELSYRGKKYTYDKWYTKPQHLASTILNTLKVQEKAG